MLEKKYKGKQEGDCREKGHPLPEDFPRSQNKNTNKLLSDLSHDSKNTLDTCPHTAALATEFYHEFYGDKIHLNGTHKLSFTYDIWKEVQNTPGGASPGDKWASPCSET